MAGSHLLLINLAGHVRDFPLQTRDGLIYSFMLTSIRITVKRDTRPPICKLHKHYKSLSSLFSGDRESVSLNDFKAAEIDFISLV
jgi:hypothetical protein